jgi:DNA phosphorothioation-dependent restriction protein DptG
VDTWTESSTDTDTSEEIPSRARVIVNDVDAGEGTLTGVTDFLNPSRWTSTE